MLSMISTRAIRPSGAQINIIQDLGLAHAQTLYERRVQSLSTPGVYNRLRKTEWDKLTAAVQATYDATLNNPELATAGIPMIQRQELAVNAAKMTYATQNAILEANFPSGAQAIALNASARGSWAGVESMPAAPRTRRAPVRRKATKKK